MKKTNMLALIFLSATLLLTSCGGAASNAPTASSTESTAADTTASVASEVATEPTPEPEKELTPITISVMTAASPKDTKWEDSIIGKKLLEENKVTLEVEYIVSDQQTKESVLLASGAYPDVVAMSINSQVWIDQEAVIPLEELYATHAKNLQAWYAQDNMMKIFKEKDGHTYKLPVWSQVAWNDGFNPGSGFMIQTKVLKEAGWPKIKTLEQYWALIEDYVKKNPEVNGKPAIGYTVRNQSWQFDSISDNPTQLLFGYHDDGGFLNQKQPDGTYKAQVASGTEQEKQYLQFMNGIFQKGLVDTEGFVEDTKQWQAKMSSGRVIGYFGWWYEMPDINAALREQGMADREYVQFPLVWKDGIQEKWYARSETSPATGIMITTSCKDPARVVQFIDALASQDNVRLMTWGEKDVDYQAGADGKFTVTPEQIKKLSDINYTVPKGIGSPVLMAGLTSDHKFDDGNPVSPALLPAFFRSSLSATMIEYLDAYQYDTMGSAYTPFVTDYGFSWSIPVPGDSEAGLAAVKLDELQREMQPKILLSKPDKFEGLYAEYLEKMSKLNLAAYHDFLTTEINSRIAARNK